MKISGLEKVVEKARKAEGDLDVVFEDHTYGLTEINAVHGSFKEGRRTITFTFKYLREFATGELYYHE